MAQWLNLKFDFNAMACPCTIMIDGQDAQHMHAAAQAAIDEVRRIEQKYSRYRPDSIVSIINTAAGQSEWIKLDEETAGLLNYADTLWQYSDGLFDITAGVLRQVWDFRAQRIPTAKEVEAVLPAIGWQHVAFDDANNKSKIRLTRPKMELDFGGFGKEYACDRAAAKLREHKINHALVNLGGDLMAIGARGLPECMGRGWRVQIQAPRENTQAMPDVLLNNQAMATSGDYERFMMHQGQRYCHIINPKTGWPVNYFQSVTVLAPTTSAAGSLTTIAMLQEESGHQWLQDQQIEFLTINPAGQINNHINGQHLTREIYETH